MWIERLVREVQRRGPVGSPANHQQGCPVVRLSSVDLGESGTNHPKVFDSDLVRLR